MSVSGCGWWPCRSLSLHLTLTLIFNVVIVVGIDCYDMDADLLWSGRRWSVPAKGLSLGELSVHQAAIVPYHPGAKKFNVKCKLRGSNVEVETAKVGDCLVWILLACSLRGQNICGVFGRLTLPCLRR